MITKIYNVFAENAFEGNPTGVVYWEGPEDEGLMQSIASNLAVPDTIFILDLEKNASSDVLCRTRTFSPYGEMAICGQGLIAVFNDLEKRGFKIDETTKVGTVIGTSQALKKQGIYYVSLGKATIENVDQDVRIKKWLAEDTGFKLKSAPCFVDLGRKRLLVEIDLVQLGKIAPDEKWVQSICGELGITGIVFFNRISDNQVRSRHFTMSLNGREDAVTGGASGAIAAILHGQSNDSCIQVHQGNFETNGGVIFSFIDEMQNVFVGGNTILQLEGKIFN